ncbi:Concanavalin A-like lectin/glucanases superfamily protein [Micromonospora pattaloongensis]|uniref:Concanavalin A-like lectin/glucanases superfamily protein n=2 Tax=Micromonospora pattaloongensis TaxID=405436 RepID=A0A1H3LZN7_9ACTN|nr:Concanavalin A-like lectin/glucanases superfamily protein [Micromonospora pattaloongensis]
MAQRCGTRVEAVAARTETVQVFANPAGYLTLEESVAPRFAKVGGNWVDADATLVRAADGSVVPRAATFPMSFSGGGATPLATLRQNGKAMSLTWPAALPQPTLNGSSATYPEVLPGVDLRVDATVTGFTHVFVVKSRAAAANPTLRELRLGVAGDGLTFDTDAATGTVSARDGSGAVLFSSASPMMWDSSGATAGVARAAAEPAAEPRQARVGLALNRGSLLLRPDTALLTGAATTYPLFIDPSWVGGLKDNAFTMVWSRSDVAGSSFWQRTNAMSSTDTVGDVGAGRTCDSSSNGACTSTEYIVRSLFRMNISGAVGKHILGAKFYIEQRHAWRCFSGNNATLWMTGSISSSTTWNNQPSWDSAYTATTTGNRRYSALSGCSGPGNIEFGVKHFVDRALATGSSVLTVGLRASSESSEDYWKRFNHASVRLSIDYNSYPTVGARSSSPATSCVAGTDTAPAANAPLINDTTPNLMAVANDADAETDLKGVFNVQRWTGTAWVAYTSPVDSIGRANGGTTVVTPVLGSNEHYRWRVTISDPWSYGGSSGTDYSSGSSWCEFKVDATPPPLPTVTSDEFPAGCDSCGGVGTTGRFNLGAGATDATGYWWGFSDPPATWVAAPAGAARTVTWTATAGGPRTLYVRTVDVAGNSSATKAYPFTVAGATPPVAQWRMAETEGVLLEDATGNGHTATLSGGTPGAEGRQPGTTAVAFDEGEDGAVSAAKVVPDTSNSFTVSAWVRLGANGNGSHTIVSQGGWNTSAFLLEYVKGDGWDAWKITTTSADVATPTYYGAQSTTASPVGRWTHLVGTYDAAAKTLTLYVDGKAVKTTANITTWKADGYLRIGGTPGFGGAISDVTVWSRVLFPSEINDMTRPLATGKAAEYHFNEVDSPFALDSSDYGRALTLTGGASIPAAMSGYDGTGLVLFDGTGQAVGTEAPIWTDQSFTVSTWVRIDGSAIPTGNRTALAQLGSKVSPFYLGLRHDSGTPKWAFAVAGSDTDQGNSWTVAYSPALDPGVVGKWVHLAGVYDAPTRGVRLYVNGALLDSLSMPQPLWRAAGPLTVGAARWTPPGGSPVMTDNWLGAIDEVRVYQGVVPQAVGEWRFDSCTGSPVACVDAAAPPHPLTLAAGATWDPAGRGEGAGLKLAGTGSAATAGAVVNTAQSFTVSSWVKLGATGGDQCAVCFEGARGAAFQLGYAGDVGGWQFRATRSDADNSATVRAAAPAAASVDTWTHLTGVYDATRATLSLYVNGELAEVTPFTGGWQASGPLAVGREKRNGAATGHWQGSVDDVRVHAGVIDNPRFLMD